MNIVCVYSLDDYYSVSKPLVAQFMIPYGLSYIITALQNAGHNVELLVFTPDTNLGLLRKTIEEFKPRMFCFTSVYTQFKLICKIAGEVKRIDPEIYSVIGGAHATLNPDEAIACAAFDAVCIGEGDYAVAELAKKVEEGTEVRAVNNFWIRKTDGSIEKNPQNSFIENLDQLPLINREIWRKWVYMPSKLTSILVSRGCPYKCSYCSNHALAKVADGKYVRFRSADNVMEEVKLIKKSFPKVGAIFLEAETLGANLKLTYELCDALAEFNASLEKPMHFGTNLTVTKAMIENPDSLISRLKSAGIVYLNIGLESGSYRLRTEVLRRQAYKNEDFIRFCNVLKDEGIGVNLYVMVGLPEETAADYEETVDCIRKCNPNYTFLSIYYPYPGTDLYELAGEKGYLKSSEDKNGSHERKKVSLNLPEFSEKQIKKEYWLFPYRVYRKKWPMPIILMHMLRNVISTHQKADWLYRRMLSKIKIMGLIRYFVTNYKV